MTHADVVVAARRLFAQPPGKRAAELDRLLMRAQAADLYWCQVCCSHPDWGDGSLGAAAWRADLPPEPALSDRDYLSCLVLVFDRLARRGSYRPAQETHLGIVASSDSRLSEISSPQSEQ